MLLSTPKQRLVNQFLKGRSAADLWHEHAIPIRPLNSTVPMSLSQEQVWLHSRVAATNHLPYNESITIHGSGRLDVAILEQSLAEIVRRHEVWRTSFDIKDGQAVQIVHPLPDVMEIPVVNLRGVSAGCREEHATRLVSEQVEEPLDLKSGPLVKAMLLEFDDTRWRLVVVAHQSVVDGVSAYQLFPSELAVLQEAFSAARPSPLSDLPIQFGDFSIWQRTWVSGDAQREQYDYWKRRLTPPLTELEWPKPNPRQMPERCVREILPFRVPQAVFEATQQLARNEGATPFAILLAGFATLLHRHTRQKDIIIGTLSPVGRKRVECQHLLGYFLNPVALRFDFSTKPTFRELIAKTRSIVAEAISHDDIPFETLEEEFSLQRNAGSFLRVAISLQPKSPVLGNGWSVTTMDAGKSGSRWDFYLAFIQRDRGFEGRVQYNTELFDQTETMATIEELFCVLTTAVYGPAARTQGVSGSSVAYI